MVWVVPQRTQHHVDRRTILAAAAFVMWNRDDAVDVRKLVAVVKCELRDRRNLLRFVAGAHARRHDQQEVARAGASVGAPGAPERRALLLGNVNGRGGG